MDADTVKKMKVSELRDALHHLSLPTTGRKEDLIQRLLSTLPPPTPLVAPKQPSLLSLDPMSLERLRARRERFGVETSRALREAEEAEAREKRAARFG